MSIVSQPKRCLSHGAPQADQWLVLVVGAALMLNSTVGIRLLRGRLLEPTDRAETEAVVVINEAMAERHWPVLALAVTRFLSSLLFEVAPTDPVVFGSVVVLLTLVGVGASLAPARRAASVDPIGALRSD